MDNTKKKLNSKRYHAVNELNCQSKTNRPQKNNLMPKGNKKKSFSRGLKEVSEMGRCNHPRN